MSYLTLEQVADEPALISSEVVLATDEILFVRPLALNDVDALSDFFGSLSPLTRERWVIDDYGKEGAQEMCDAIARYDKLRLVVTEHDAKIIGLMEFSFSIVPFDVERFASYGIELDEDRYIRFGPCVRDDAQRKGIFSVVMPKMVDIAKGFGNDFIILWGGVLADNVPAIKSYEKLGFYEVGKFNDRIDESECIDMILDLRNVSMPNQRDLNL